MDVLLISFNSVEAHFFFTIPDQAQSLKLCFEGLRRIKPSDLQ